MCWYKGLKKIEEICIEKKWRQNTKKCTNRYRGQKERDIKLEKVVKDKNKVWWEMCIKREIEVAEDGLRYSERE